MKIVVIVMGMLGMSTYMYGQNSNQSVIDKAVEILVTDLKLRGDYNSCVFLSEDEFVESSKVFITEYAGQFAETEDPIEIVTLAEEALIHTLEQVVLQEGLFMDNFLECKNDVIDSFVPSEGMVLEEDSIETELIEEQEVVYTEPEKTEIPDFVIDFPTYEPTDIVDQVDNIAMWVDEVENGRPAIIFASNDELDSIKAFYLNELPDFFQINIDDMIILCEEEFDLRDLYSQEGREKWFQMRSVWIEPNHEYDDVFPGLVKIEIHY